MDGYLRQLATGMLGIYHRFVSPVLPQACRFFPTCSVYASQAINKHGLIHGAFLGVKRLSRCHAWHPGGYDPVR
jgi:uncharacterized protein